LLKLSEVRTSYGRIEALKGVGLEVERGEIVTLIGANGAGKSTTLMTICGVTPAAAGTIEFLGQRIERLSPPQIVRRGVVQVPEGRRIFPHLTVLENLRMGAFSRDSRQEAEQDLARAFALFPVLGERRGQRGGTLSGGEQQMLAIARALMARPQLLLLDEPSMGLAPVLQQAVYRAIREINQQGMTVLLVEQNAHMALRLAQRAYVMEAGRIVLAGWASELRQDPAVRRAYLGEEVEVKARARGRAVTEREVSGERDRHSQQPDPAPAGDEQRVGGCASGTSFEIRGQ
jgi:branched-chain amino acid transport system ATP-binding protein